MVTSPASRLPARTVLALIAALAVPTLAAPDSGAAGAGYLAGLLIGVVALWRGARRAEARSRRGWTLIALAGTCWLVGDSVQRMFDWAGMPVGDSVGVPDVFWLGSYPLLAFGITAMIRHRGLPRTVAHELRLDTTVVTVAGALGAWAFMIRPGLRTDGWSLVSVVGALYPVGDIVLLAAGLTLVMAPGRRGASQSMIVGCLSATLLLDVAFSVLPHVAPSFDEGRLDGVLLAVNGLLAAAALHPSACDVAAPAATGAAVGRIDGWRVALLGGALVAVSVIAAIPMEHVSASDRIVFAAAALATSVTVVLRFAGVVRQRERAEAELAHRANHDVLTGLVNRSMLLDELTKALGPSRIGDVAVAYLDLDGFKTVNDRHGHRAGDVVLQTTGARLKTATRRGDIVARLGGDEFVVVCFDVGGESLETLGRHLCEVVRDPIELPSGEQVEVGVSIGIALTDASGEPGDADADAERLLHLADSAMYSAKHAGGGVRHAA